MDNERDRVILVAEALEVLHAHTMSEVFPRIAGEMHLREMSFSQFVSMMQIFMNGPQTISEIAQGANITHTAASRMVDRLVKSGLLSRKENSDDRREKIIELTALGRALPPSLRQTSIGAYSAMLGSLPADLVAELQRVMEKIMPLLPPVPEPYSEG